jgi:orotate phosphoribosyltransferase
MPELVHAKTSAEDVMRSVGALQTGHFLLTSGLHSDQYMQGQRVLQYPRYGNILANQLAEQIVAAGLQPDVVIGPALGAIHWEVFVANALDAHSEKPIKAMFAERSTESGTDPNSFILRRGMELTSKDKVLVVEDVTTTGGSVKRVLELVKALGAEPIAVGAIVDRSGSTIEFGVPFLKLITLNLQTYTPADCPMCAQGTTAIKPGSSKQK